MASFMVCRVMDCSLLDPIWPHRSDTKMYLPSDSSASTWQTPKSTMRTPLGAWSAWCLRWSMKREGWPWKRQSSPGQDQA